MQVVSNTWARDSHDLFDFEAQQLHTQTFNVSGTTKFVRNGAAVGTLTEPIASVAQPPGADALLRLVQRDGTYWVDRATTPSTSRKVWLVVRGLASPGHRLLEGDVIKLGRFKFRVRQQVASECFGVQPELRLDSHGTAQLKSGAEFSSTICRICLMEGPADDDPLVAPCQCKGSIEHVHIGCLRHWIAGRLNISDTTGGSYFFRPLACELCKATYPTHVQSNGKTEFLAEVPRTTPPFIVVENMVRDSQQHSSRGLHVLSLADNKVVKLGRGHESDVRIADVSISRCHATVRFHNGGFFLEDNNSKFGTLVAVKKPLQVVSEVPVSIQMGRTVMSFTLTRPGEDGVRTTLFPQPADDTSTRDGRQGQDMTATRTSAESEMSHQATL